MIERAVTIMSHRITLLLMAGSVVLLAILYVVFANSAVRIVTTLEDMRDKVESVRIEVSELEARSFSYESNLSKERAFELGLVEVENPLFIVKSESRKTLSLSR